MFTIDRFQRVLLIRQLTRLAPDGLYLNGGYFFPC